MKRSIIAIAASVLLATSMSTFACEGKHDHKRGGFYNLDRLDRVLDLSDSQRAQLETLKEQGKQQRREAFKTKRKHNLMAMDPSSADYQTQVQALAEHNAEMAKERTLKMAEFRSQVHAILTPEQREILKQKMEKRRDKMEKRMKNWEDE